MKVLRRHALAEHDLCPRVHAEEFAVGLPGVCALPEQGQALRQRVGHLHVAAVAPEAAVVALGGVVVEDDEVANVLDLGPCVAVVLSARDCVTPPNGNR